MNHERIATQALRYRFSAVRGPLAHPSELELEAMARISVTAAEPSVDGAIRRLASCWCEFGIPLEDLTEPWTSYRVTQLFEEYPELIDALDDIVRVAVRPHAA